MNKITSFVVIPIGLCFCISIALSQNVAVDTVSKKDTNNTQIEKIADNLYRFGNVMLDSKKREITLPGKINMQKGMIELLACAPGGKVHESVLVLDIVPYHFQVALLLLGLNYVGGLEYQGDPTIPKGDSVEIYVSWKIGEKDTMVKGEDLVWDIPRKKSMEHTAWIFAGSKVVEGKFMADVDKSLVTTYHDPFSILDNPLSTGADDEVYQVNEKLTPAKGTPVIVLIKSLK